MMDSMHRIGVAAILVMAIGVWASPPKPKAPTIAPGKHMCQVSDAYRYRPCTVSRSGDELVLDTTGGLIQLHGTLRADGKDLVFEGVAKDEIPFGCEGCIEGELAELRDVYPRARCIPLLRAAHDECMQQRPYVRLKHRAGRWSGVMIWYSYYNEYEYLPDETNRITGFTKTRDEIRVTID